ncbi:MAG: MFS transporter [Synergistaceae bacterium]|jgi:FSR family fosmidomycin resistance protein-like MFS transporter|nr:MFS transporter [Synergistaceae bacterium]
MNANRTDAGTTTTGAKASSAVTKFGVLAVISLSHFLNDATQALLIPIYPMLMARFSLDFTELGMISMTYQITGSLLQPLIGRYTDKHPQPRSLAAGMCLTLAGILTLSVAPSYMWLILGSCILGTGSSIFHPESSRVARMASGGRFGFAQSVFQVGGNAGQACGPLLAAAFIMPHGQYSLSWFAALPLTAIALLLWIGGWEADRLRETEARVSEATASPLPRGTVLRVFGILLVLIFSKYFYIASINNYFIFYLTRRFGISVEAAQMRLFLFMFAMATGTLLGGPIGDRIGRRYVIWISILGAAPFTLAMPYLDLTWTTITTFVIGFVLSSAFSAIVVFAQELLPGHVGTVAGLFFGLSFGMAGIGAAVLGRTADLYGIDLVYHICAFLPLLGLFAVFLPKSAEAARPV